MGIFVEGSGNIGIDVEIKKEDGGDWDGTVSPHGGARIGAGAGITTQDNNVIVITLEGTAFTGVTMRAELAGGSMIKYKIGAGNLTLTVKIKAIVIGIEIINETEDFTLLDAEEFSGELKL